MVQSNEDDNLSPKKPYPDKTLNLDDLRKGRTNIIVAPRHSGKELDKHQLKVRKALLHDEALQMMQTSQCSIF